MPITNVTVPSVLTIPVTYSDPEGINVSSLSSSFKIQNPSGNLLSTTLVGTTGTGNTVTATYEWSTVGRSNGSFIPATTGQQDNSGNVAVLTTYPDDSIEISQNASSTGSNRELDLTGLNGFPAPAVEWFSYPTAQTTFTSAGVEIRNSQTTDVGLISSTVTGPGFTPAGGDVVEIDFLGLNPDLPSPSTETSQSGVGLGAIGFNDETFSLILDGVIMWNANGSVLAGVNSNAPQQVEGRKHRLRIVFNAAVTVATLRFFEDANNNGNYTVMTPASVNVAVTPEIASGTTLGFDTGSAGPNANVNGDNRSPLTISRVSIPN